MLLSQSDNKAAFPFRRVPSALRVTPLLTSVRRVCTNIEKQITTSSQVRWTRDIETDASGVVLKNILEEVCMCASLRVGCF